MEYYYEKIKKYILETYREVQRATYIRGTKRPYSYILKYSNFDRYILMFDFENLSTISKRVISSLQSGDIWIIAKAYHSKAIFEVVLSKPLLSEIMASEPSRRNGSYHLSSRKLDDGILLLHASNKTIEIPVGEITIFD